MRALHGLVAIALVAASACGGVRDAIRDAPISSVGAFDARELLDVLPYGRVRAIERPRFESPAEATEWLPDSAPVAVLTIGADARAYPLAILLWHEVVNDVVGGKPVVVTYSPLTGATLGFERGAAAFAPSGKLYRSGLVMADRRTRSLWPQLLGRAVAGPAKGDDPLPAVPVQVASFGAFMASFPSGAVLTRETGVVRAYGATPYAGYLDRKAPFPSFFASRTDARLPPMERVIGIPDSTGGRAYRLTSLTRDGVVNDRTAAGPIVLFWQRGVRSVLDATDTSRGREVGSAAAFLNSSSAGPLDFEVTMGGFRDRNTGSTWTVLGVATGGPLKGERLAPLLAVEAFWFAWAGFHPSTGIAGS